MNAAKKTTFLCCTLLLLLACPLIGTGAPISRTVNYQAKTGLFDPIDKDILIPDYDKFHLHLNFFLSPGTTTTEITGEIIFDQETQTIKMLGQDGNFSTDGGMSFTGTIEMDFVIPGRFFKEFFGLSGLKILNVIFDFKDVHIDALIPLFKYGKDWKNATAFQSLLLSSDSVQVRAGIPDIFSKKITVEDLAGVILTGLTGIPPAIVNVAKWVIQKGLGSSGISLNAGLTSDLTLSCKTLTVNGVQITQEARSISAPGLDLSKRYYLVNTEYVGDLGRTLDLLLSADYEFMFNPFGILIWEYDEPFAELPINIIPEFHTDLVFNTNPTTIPFPITQAPAARPPEAVTGNQQKVTLAENGVSWRVDVAPYFSSTNALRYRVTSDNTSIARVSPSGWQSRSTLFKIQPRNAGSTTMVITAEDPSTRLTATQTIAVTVEGTPPNYTDTSQPITSIGEQPKKNLRDEMNVVLILDESPYVRNIRDDAGFNSGIVDQANNRDTGVIKNGPVNAGGHTWYQVEWDHLPNRNNRWWISVYRKGTQILVHNPPDLEIYAFDVGRSSVKPGGELTLEADIRNNGPGDSDPTEMVFYYSPKRHDDVDELLDSLKEGTLKLADIGGSFTVKVPSIRKDRRKTVEVEVNAPLTPHTDYYYGAILWPEPVFVTETQAWNNFTTEHRHSRAEEEDIEITSDPDFIVSSISADKSTLNPGDRFRLDATVKNQGLGTQISNAYLYYHRSSDETITDRDPKASSARDQISKLDTNKKGDESITLTAPQTPGVYYYGACVSYRYEIKKDNNCSSAVAITVREVPTAPDLIVEPFSVSPTTLNPGGTFTLNATVKNRGNRRSDATVLRYYQSSNTRISASDVEVDSSSIRALNTQESIQKKLSLTAPIASGTYYYGACVDDIMLEKDTRNNCSVGFAITVKNLPPVAIDTPLPAPTLLANGSSVTIDMQPYFSDPNDDELSYQVRTENRNIVAVYLFGGSESRLTIDPLNVRGTATVVVEAKDAGSLNWSARQNITVTVTEPSDITSACNRTPQIRDALTRTSYVADCADITSVHLDTLTTLVLAREGITALKVDDFDGLANLTTLDLSGNQLTGLPSGVFAGLRSLTELDVSGNPGAPFILHPVPIRTDTSNRAAAGPATITVYVAQGAPFDMDVSLTAEGGTLSETIATIATGNTHSQSITVTPTGTGAVTVMPSVSRVPSDYHGLQTSPGNPLVLFDATVNQAPIAVVSIPSQTLSTDGAATTLDLSNYFRDADNDPLTYIVTSSNQNVATSQVSGSMLTITPQVTGSAILTITVSDGSLTNTITVAVTVTAPNINMNDCQSGGILAPGESCTYPGTDTEFAVNSNGNGQFLFFSSGSRLNIRNTQIKNVSYTLVAEKLNSGSWEIKELGTPPLTTNNAPVFTEGASTTRTVAENTASGTNIGSAVAATDADSSDTLTYTLGGTDAAAFRIISTSGQLQTRAALDYETKNAYTVTVSVSDGNGGSNNITVTINVTDVTVEPPPSTNNAPVFTEGASTTRTVAENTVAGINIGSVVAATDADNDILTYSLGGTNASSFRIVSTSGQLQTNAALDYETKSSYSVSVSVSDGNGGSDSITVTISVTDVVETGTPPVADGICRVGDTLAPGESCTYSGTDTEFSVNSNGNGQFLFFSSGSRLNIRNTEINNVSYTLVAEKLDSGSWEIKELGAIAAPPPSTNNAPVFTEGASTTRTVAENTAAGINIGTPVAATDADNDTLTYSLGGTDAAAFDIDGTTGQLKTKATLNASTKSTYAVTITVSDGTDTATIPVTITVTGTGIAPPPPVADGICRVGDTLAPGESCTYSGTDTEFSINSNGNGRFLFFSSGSRLNIRNTQINNVSYTLVAEKLDSGSWEIKELGPPINRAPVAVGTISDRTLTAGDSASTVDVSSSFNDPNNDTLTYTATSSATGIATVSVSEAVVTITPIGTGSATITVTASDGTLTATQTISVTVAAPNRAPVAVGTISDRTLTAGGSTTTVNVSSSFNDPDNDTLTYTATSSATGIATVRVSRAVVTITPIGTGSATITVTASDGTLTATQTISVTVSAAPVANRAPVAVGTISDRTLTAGGSTTTVNVSSNFNDPDNDTLTYTATSSATGVATVSASDAHVTITPVTAGSATITVTASDGTLTATQTIAVTVSAAPVANRAPVAVGTISDRTLTAGGSTTTVNVSSNFNDPDNDTLTYTATSSATGVATVSASDAHVTITPVTAGSATITVKASDGTLTATQTISVTVSDAPVANRAPVTVGAISARTFTVGDSSEQIDVSSNFNDPDNDTLTYTATSSATGVATVSASDAHVTITPVTAGSATITVKASDGTLTATQTISVTVSDAPVANRAPVAVGTISARTLTVGDSPLVIDVSNNFRDPEGNSLSYTATSNNTSAATVSASDSQVTITPRRAGSATITVTASDGELTATQTIALSITDSSSISVIPDPNLATAVRQTLGLGANDDITQTHIQRLTSLEADSRRITNLTGLEYATSLKTLILSNNQISNVSSLSTLTNLTVLSLWINNISDVSALSTLVNLKTLYLSRNDISDVSALSTLTNLDFLGLHGNNISDVSALSTLTNLKSLYLYNNQISDVSPLTSLTNLEILHLNNNQIAALPTGLFGGFSNLRQLYLSPNPGGPFTLTLELARTDNTDLTSPGPATVKVRVAEGAPFAMSVNLSVYSGTLSATTATIAKGSTESSAITVTQTGNGATTVSLGTAPSIPSANYKGVQPAVGDSLILFNEVAENNAPFVVSPISTQTLFVGGPDETVNISDNFRDSDGDTLTYTASSNNTTVADVSRSGSTLTITPKTAGSATVTVTASDGSLTVTLEFEVDVLSSIILDENLAVVVRETLGLGANDDITYVNILGLTHLRAARHSASPGAITDLTGLENATNLTMLDLSRNAISDLSPLAALTNLTSLTLRDNDISISDISALKTLTNLTSLDLLVNEISDVTPLKNLTNLTYLGLHSNDISDVTSLKNLTNLTSLTLDINEISDLSPLAALTNLTNLNLAHNEISDVTPLKNLTKLTNLNLQDNDISDVTPLKNLTKLTRAILFSNDISDVTPLKGLTNLKSLGLSGNSISNVSPLGSLTNLTSLVLQSNVISDISSLKALTNLRELYISNNQIAALPVGMFKNFSNLTTLRLDGNSGAPFTLTLELERTDNTDLSAASPATVKVKLAEGAPFAMSVSLSVTDGTLSTTTATIAKGNTESSAITVTQTGNGATTVSLGTAPSIPSSNYKGIQTAVGESLVLFSVNGAPTADRAELPNTTALLSNYPNPFNPETWIPYQLAKPADVTLTIYDVRGVVVRELRLGHKVAGVYTSRSRAIHWDGRNAFGEKMATGVYFYTLKAGEFTATRKLLIAK